MTLRPIRYCIDADIQRLGRLRHPDHLGCMGARDPPGKMMTAGYASLENVSRDVITITGVSAQIAGHTSLHETRIERDRSTMRPVAELSIEAGERVSLKPGGLHIMLMKLSESLTDGQSIDICLELENNDSLCSAFSVARHGKAAHHH